MDIKNSLLGATKSPTFRRTEGSVISQSHSSRLLRWLFTQVWKELDVL